MRSFLHFLPRGFGLMLCLTGGATAIEADPEAHIIRFSAQEFRDRVDRLQRDEKRPAGDALMQILREKMEQAGKQPIVLGAGEAALLFGERFGLPDPWAVPGDDKAGLVGLHADLRYIPDPAAAPPADDNAGPSVAAPEVLASNIQRLQRKFAQAEWNEKVPSCFPTSRGLLLLVPVANIAALEHELMFPLQGFPSVSQVDKGEVEEMKAFYLAAKPLEGERTTIAAVLARPVEFRDRRITLVARFIAGDEGSSARSVIGGEAILLKEASPKLRLTDGRIRYLWELPPDSGKVPENRRAAFGEDERPWHEGKPALLTGILRLGDYQYAGITMKDKPSLELESVRELAVDDPEWIGANTKR